MRFMILVHATEESEAGVMPSTELLTEMGSYNEELVKAGLMLDGNGLHPSARAVRVRFSGDQRTVIDGPFAETKELVAGYWIWRADSLEQAIEWVKKCPNPMEGESVIEIRRIYEAEDFGAEFTPEAREQEKRLWEEAQAAEAERMQNPDGTRRMLILLTHSPAAEGRMPSEQELTEMGNFNEELVRAGIMAGGEGLHPSRDGARVVFSGRNRTVVDGPFTESKELVAGFWVWRVKSMEEAIEWVKRAPLQGTEIEVQIRPVFEAADFGEAYTPEVAAQEDRIRAELSARPVR